MSTERILDIMNAMEGEEYNQGILEDVTVASDNIRTVIANLLDFLENKGLLTEDDLENKIMTGLRGSSPRYKRETKEIRRENEEEWR